MDLLIIGAGLSGAVIANKAAKAGKKVLILEKRKNIGGNIFDKKIEGITAHMYGPHIFHTNNEEVNTYMNQFWTLNNFQNRVEGRVAGKVVPIPFNFKGIDKFWPEDAIEIKKLLVEKYGKDKRISIFELSKAKEEILQEVSEFIYKNVFLNYTVKMWGLSPSQIDQEIASRVPVVIGEEDRYFSDKYEGVPVEGYTATIKKMLDSENIEVRANVDASIVLERQGHKIFFEELEVTCPIIYSGRLDEFFHYKFGLLDYRSIDIKFEVVNVNRFQTTAVSNTPAHPTRTRITEYKNMTFEEVKDKTVISKEYPGKFQLGDPKFGIPFYPNPTDKSRDKYNNYAAIGKKINNFYPIGRLATYEYINMDQAIAKALELADKILE